MSVRLIPAEEFNDGYDTFGEERAKVGRSLNDVSAFSLSTCIL